MKLFKLRVALIGIALITALFFIACPSQDREEFVSIGTGGVTGVYYPTGGAISRMVNIERDTYNLRVTVESTGGSVYNINAVLAGDLEFGIAQSDRQYQATRGLAEWEDAGPQTDLRSVFSIHPETITLVASVNSGIESAKDLAGKRVNIGNPGSGQIQNSRDIFDAFGIDEESIQTEQVKASEAPSLLQDGRLDAFFFTVGHPNGTIKEATSGRISVRFVPITGAGVDALLSKNPFYAQSLIPIKEYPNAENSSDIPGVGVKATLITSADVSDDIVYAVTREVFENFEDFRALHPAYSTLQKEDLLAGLSAPLHPGAIRYYEEAGLIGQIDPSLL